MPTTEITAENFQQALEADGILLLDFWAEWCGPCRSFAPVFEMVSGNHPDIVFGKVDIEKEQDIAAAYKIRSVPTLMLFRDRVLMFSQSGALSAAQLEDLVAKAKALDMDEVREEIRKQAE